MQCMHKPTLFEQLCKFSVSMQLSRYVTATYELAVNVELKYDKEGPEEWS